MLPVWGSEAVEVNKEGGALLWAHQVHESCHQGDHSCLHRQHLPLHTAQCVSLAH